MSSSHRFLTRPVVAAIIAAAALAPLTAVRAADWQEWTPLADRYQGGIDYRIRPAGKKDDPGIQVQLRNHYAQKVTITLLFVGPGASGEELRAPLTQALDAGDTRKPKEGAVVRVPLASLTSVTVSVAAFEGTPPSPTPEGQPGNVAYLTRLLAAAQADAATAENQLHDAQSVMQSTDSAMSERSAAVRTAGGASGSTEATNPGEVVAANGAAQAASDRLTAAQERVAAIQRQIKAAESATPDSGTPLAAPAAATPAGFVPPADIQPGKPLTAKQINELLDAARASAQAQDWDQTAGAFRYVLDNGGSILKDPDRARIDSSMGAALANAGRNQDAETALRESLRLNANQANTEDTLGLILVLEQRYADAVAAFKEAVRLDPKSDSYAAHLEDAQNKAKGS